MYLVSSLVLGLHLTAASSAQAQGAPQTAARNSVYMELLGNGGMYSINVEREILPQLRLRIGVATWAFESDGFFFESTTTESHTTFPLMLNYGVGSGTSSLEVGGGLLLGWRKRTGPGENETSSIRSLTGTIGYRYQPRQGGFLFRAGFVPFYSLNSEEDAYPDPGLFASVGVSLGYAF